MAQFQSGLPGTCRPSQDGGLDGWCYPAAPGGKGFSLTQRLGWEPSLEYHRDGLTDRWVFAPGDGSPEMVIALRP